MSNEKAALTGIFRNPDDAGRALHELRRAGYGDSEIGFIAPDTTPPVGVPPGSGARDSRMLRDGPVSTKPVSLSSSDEQVFTGGALAASMDDTVPSDRVSDVLIGMGLPEDQARYCRLELEAGHPVIVVCALGREQEALNILYHHHAYNACSGLGAAPGAHFAAHAPD